MLEFLVRRVLRILVIDEDEARDEPSDEEDTQHRSEEAIRLGHEAFDLHSCRS